MRKDIIVKTNGYRIGEDLKRVIDKFNDAAYILFGDRIVFIEHFYYGDRIDMVTIYLHGGSYADFNLTAKRVSFNGHSCLSCEFNRFEALTWNDECYNGMLWEIDK